MARTVAIIQARMGSTRLPGKVMKPFCGMPMLAFQLRRLRVARKLDAIIVATSDTPADDAIAALCAQEGVACFRGSESDVLGRMAAASDTVVSDVVVRLTGDNPLVDPAIVDRVVAAFDDPGVDHVSTFANPSYPYGTGCGAFRTRVLREADQRATTPFEREHVEPYMLQSAHVRTLHLAAEPSLHRPEISVTVDTEADFAKVHRAASALERRVGPQFTTADIITWFDDCPMVVIANAQLGLEAIEYLANRRERIVGLILPPDGEGSCQDRIAEISGLAASDIFRPTTLKSEPARSWLLERKPELVTSFWSRFIIPREIIEGVPRGITNLHNSLLPLARGGEANIWTIIDRHAAGVSLHYIAEAIDLGPLIAQREVEVHSWDTGKSLYARLEQQLLSLFVENWPRVRVGPVNTTAQAGTGTYHGRRASDAIRQIELDATYTGRELIDRLRALTFPPYAGAYFDDDDGNRVDVKIVLERIGSR